MNTRTAIRRLSSLYFFLFFVIYSGLFSQKYSEVEAYILNFQFQKVDSILSTFANSPHKHYYTHHKLFYQQFFYENYPSNLFFEKSDSILNLLKDDNSNKLWKKVFLGEIYLERTIFFYLQKSYWSAYVNFREAYKISQDIELQKHIFFSKRIKALMEIFLGSVPSKYKWITNLLGYTGDLSKGIQIFESILPKSEIQKDENQILMFYLSKHLLNDSSKAFQSIYSIYTKNPKNVFFNYLMGIHYLDKKDLVNAKKHLLFCYKHPIMNFEYPIYHLAHVYLYNLELDSASYFFVKFIEKKRGNIFKADAHYKLGLIFSIKNQKTEAQKYFYRAIQFEEQISDKDLHAINISKILIYKPLSKEELLLYQARWLFDGGKYQKALEYLNQIQSNSNQEIKIEISYRRGRIYQEIRNYHQALQSYQEVFNISTVQNKWMKPYSAYYIALIYEQKKEYENAKFYLKKALSYNDYDFQASLEQKAKTLLAKLEKKGI